MNAELVVLYAMGAALIAYVLTGGADFGGGVWDLLARGPTAKRQRKLIEHAIAPIWEANHIWLIFLTVISFTAFPRAFAVIATAFHIPLLLALLGIVGRGAAFTFRAYGLSSGEAHRSWQRIFAWSSVLAPLFLGVTLAGLSSGAVRLERDMVASGFVAGWTTGFAWATGAFTIALCAMLSAVYLTRDALRAGEADLADAFRTRAITAEIVSGAISMVVLWRASHDAPALYANLLDRPWSMPVQIATATLAIATIAALWARRYTWAQVLVAFQVAFVVLGWGLAMDRYLVFGSITIDNAGARPQVLGPLLWVLAIGGFALLPALYALFRVFKSTGR